MVYLKNKQVYTCKYSISDIMGNSFKRNDNPRVLKLSACIVSGDVVYMLTIWSHFATTF